MPWRDRMPVDAPRSRWEWAAANWLRFAVIAAAVASVLVSWTAQRQTIANRDFGKGSREITCALLRDHTVPGSPIYSAKSVLAYDRQCKGTP